MSSHLKDSRTLYSINENRAATKISDNPIIIINPSILKNEEHMVQEDSNNFQKTYLE